MYQFFVHLMQPFTVLALATLIGLVLAWRRRLAPRKQLWLLTVPLVGMMIMSMPAVAYLAIGSLEWWYPPEPTETLNGEPLVVLSGWAFRPDHVGPKAFLGMDSQLRCRHAAELYHQARCQVFVCGGLVKPDDLGGTLAELMRDFLIELGVDADDIVMESSSRNTYENALYAAPLLREQNMERIRLVTTACHLPRATRCFVAQGFEVVPMGCSYMASGFEWSLLGFVPQAAAAVDFQAAAHEWVGLFLYWMQGHFQEQPVPAPNAV